MIQHNFIMQRSMHVIKRDGTSEAVSFDKVLRRIQKAARGLHVQPDTLAQRVLSQIFDGVKTSDLDELAAQLAASLSTLHPDYATLASRLTVSNHHKNSEMTFAQVVKALSHQTSLHTDEEIRYVSESLEAVTDLYPSEIEAKIDYQRDYDFDYFGFKTLEKSYLLKNTKGVVLERPQHMWMRVALALWTFGSKTTVDELHKAFETYDLMSQKIYTHATPTLFNAGTPRQQLSSCFLMAMADDSITGIYKSLADCAAISKYAGGIGIHCHNIRARGSLIKGTNGTSNGLVPMLRVFNNTARYVDQCFTPDTLIYTLKGPKEIKDVGITDQVLTSSGDYESVNLPVRHEYSGKMLDIQIKNAVYPVRVTPEHQILALKGQALGLNFDVITNRLEKNIAKPEYCDAGELMKGDFVVFPIPQYECDIKGITEEDCRFYGILLGDGHISGPDSGVCLNNTSKIDTMNFILDYLNKRGITPNTYTDDKTERIKWSTASPGFKFTHAQLYDDNKQKQVDVSMLHLPLNKIKQIVRGIIETDGCVGTKEIAVELSSYPLIEALRYMLLRLGSLSSGYERNRVGNMSTTRDIMTRLPTAVLRIPRLAEILEYFPNAPEGEFFSYLRYGSHLYSRIESITETSYTGMVYDFEIESPHDYTVAHLGLAHNGGGRRNGSFAMYLEPWHADIDDFLKMKLNSGAEEERARDLFYALWIPDLFMKRVEEDGVWTLFCPNEAPGLADVYGDEFDALYTRYEKEGRGRKTVSAQKLWFKVLDSQMETGTPYLLYKDPANKKSNQKNIGIIKSSNLCTEIMEVSTPTETAVCNLASVALPAFVSDDNTTFNFEKLRSVTASVVKALNRVIDINFYPTPEGQRSNMRHRPIGLGVQGLSDVFARLRLPWESPEASRMNQLIFEHMYYAAVEASVKLALDSEEGAYATFEGSPTSKGLLQPDLWSVVPITEKEGTLDWAKLRKWVTGGIRNSLLIAPMPTASTSQILGYTECFEPMTSNIYARRTLAGEYVVVNRYLMNDLMQRGLWNESLKQRIIAQNGSVQGIKEISEDLQALYKTSWEIKQKTLISMAADRGAFICQSQSLNLFMENPTYAKLTSMHFYAWKQGLKTGCYYLRTKAPVMAQKFTVDPRMLQGSAAPVNPLDTTDDVEESESDEDLELSAEEKKAKERKALKDRLAREYEQSVKEAKDAADAGEGCTMCSS
jgi:ribonucleoside-diphosphate reductase alpha chain